MFKSLILYAIAICFASITNMKLKNKLNLKYLSLGLENSSISVFGIWLVFDAPVPFESLF